MKVILSDGEGNALIQFDNLVYFTNVVGVKAPIQAEISGAHIAGIEQTGQHGREAAQRFINMVANAPQ